MSKQQIIPVASAYDAIFVGIQKAKKNKLDQDPVFRNKMLDIMYHAQVSKDLEDKLKDIIPFYIAILNNDSQIENLLCQLLI